MRRRRFNAMLTLNAILIAMLALVLIADRGTLAPNATAAMQQGGIPDAGSQRLEMIRELRRLNTSIEALRKGLEKTEFNVKVLSMPVVRVEGE